VAYYRIQVAQQLDCGNPQGLEPEPCEPFVTSSVALRPVPALVNLSVHLDNQPARRTEEIERVRPARMLFAKAELARAVAEHGP